MSGVEMVRVRVWVLAAAHEQADAGAGEEESRNRCGKHCGGVRGGVLDVLVLWNAQWL